MKSAKRIAHSAENLYPPAIFRSAIPRKDTLIIKLMGTSPMVLDPSLCSLLFALTAEQQQDYRQRLGK